ncbi:uncharacterized protein LOC113306119 [Papaver somniferum]|uniref:uncharacterized protein LOC113306119 n=1 Tax=Papaver somniferum TaxID=3469 RepID=UPI000E6FCD79|nr:uncharacterized protein LOC113306119 [Papaver somniferum]
MGLSNHWVKLINQCVSTVSYSVLLNSSPTGFSPTWESFHKNGTLEGIKVCKEAPEMTHLLFADDSLLFSKATEKNFHAIKDYLQKYCIASGQEINFEKSGILFSMKIPEHKKAILANTLDIQSIDLGEKYLGTSTVFQASKIQTHMGILQAIDARISIWLHKLLSQAARTTLIKHIGQAIPLFQMGAFLIPKHLCKQMDSHLCKFWWGETLDPKDRKLHLLGWDILCSPKAGEVSACYQGTYKTFISWIVGDGQFIYPWCDKWIPYLGSATPNPLVPPDPSIKVAYFIDSQIRSWDVSRLNTHFDNASVQKIISISLSQLCTPDRRVWDLSKNGKFSFKSAYLGLRGIRPSPCKNLWRCILKVRVPYRIQVFLWRASRNALPSRIVLHTRMPMHGVDCPGCSDPRETIMHALVSFPFANKFKLPEDDQCLFVAIIWSLWASRNNLIYRGVKENFTAVLARARAMLLTRKSRNPSLTILTTMLVIICDKWIPPLLVRLNVILMVPLILSLEQMVQAHELALWDKQNNSTMYWSKPPVWILPTVEEDH